jgi:hypothetical protein
MRQSILKYILFFKGIFPVLQIILPMAVLLGLQNCANPVTPTGGPTDVDPPVLLNAVPPLYTTNFDATQIRLTFNEFIELKGINQQLIVSPPMETAPTFRIRGKSLLVDLKEPLMENTTYTFYFGEAITDITENNPLQDFHYVFSTGDILDSLSLEGKIVHAFDNQPAQGVNVMLYIDNNDTIPFDSLPYLVKPYSMTRSGNDGAFRLNNLSDKPFLLFALEDLNASLKYDQPNERIAFFDTLVRPYYTHQAIDTLMGSDTTEITEPYNTPVLPDPLEMYLFEEKDTVQRFITATILKEKQLVFVFKIPAQSPEINALGVDSLGTWSLPETNKTGDTLTFWIKEIPADTVFFEVKDSGLVLDTARVRMKPASASGRRRGNVELETELNTVPLQMNSTRRAPELNMPFVILFDYPVIHSDPSKIIFIESEDTLQANFVFEDTINRRASITHAWKESTAYQIIIPDSTFHDLSGSANDTIIRHFVTKSLADYGHLFLNITLENPGQNHIIQLLQKEVVVREIHLKESSQVRFEYLNPGGYQLKVIYDDNGNRVWDTGSYSDKRQPEKVTYFPDEINIRANWDVVEDWEL